MPLRFAFAGLALLGTLWCSVSPAAPLALPDVQASLQAQGAHSTQTTAPVATPMEQTEARRLVARHLDKRLLSTARRIEGWTFLLPPTDAGATPDIGIVLLDYRDEATATQQHERLARQARHFKHSKVLTPFGSAAAGTQVVIVFTGKAGNPVLARLVRTLPGDLQARRHGSGSHP
ncbi:MAG: hypothetical protein WAQ08_15320 [Aquabacterium sp.]|jgi:hypothetical protein|uniref:hypothetical protein n=1 Tax=Aquabacterium sp. TaxID=1872578 RepID=UPI003BAF6C99